MLLPATLLALPLLASSALAAPLAPRNPGTCSALMTLHQTTPTGGSISLKLYNELNEEKSTWGPSYLSTGSGADLGGLGPVVTFAPRFNGQGALDITFSYVRSEVSEDPDAVMGFVWSFLDAEVQGEVVVWVFGLKWECVGWESGVVGGGSIGMEILTLDEEYVRGKRRGW